MSISVEGSSFEKGVQVYIKEPSDRATALYRLRRSIAVGNHSSGALRAGEEMSKYAGVRRMAVICMDPRNATGLIKDFGVQVVKFGGAVAATREVKSSGQEASMVIPNSDFFAGSLQFMAMDTTQESLLVASPHFGEIPCGYMHGLEHQMIQQGAIDPYQGDRVTHNLDLIQQGTILPATEIFNFQLAAQGSSFVRKLGVKLPWNTDKASLVLSYDYNDSSRTLMVADLVTKYAGVFEERFGVAGQFRSEIRNLKNNGDFWALRTRMVKEISDSTHFREFREDLEKWRDNSPECDGLTDNQWFGLITQIADNASLIHSIDTARKRSPRLAEFFPHQIFISLNGVTLDEKDPNASRLSSSPLNGENIGDTLIGMVNLSFEKAGMVQEIVDSYRQPKGRHRLLQLPPRRVAFVSFGVNPEADDLKVALSQLGKAMRSVNENPRSRQFIAEGRLSVVPVVVNIKTSAALIVPIFPDYN